MVCKIKKTILSVISGLTIVYSLPAKQSEGTGEPIKLDTHIVNSQIIFEIRNISDGDIGKLISKVDSNYIPHANQITNSCAQSAIIDTIIFMDTNKIPTVPWLVREYALERYGTNKMAAASTDLYEYGKIEGQKWICATQENERNEIREKIIFMRNTYQELGYATAGEFKSGVDDVESNCAFQWKEHK